MTAAVRQPDWLHLVLQCEGESATPQRTKPVDSTEERVAQGTEIRQSVGKAGGKSPDRRTLVECE